MVANNQSSRVKARFL